MPPQQIDFMKAVRHLGAMTLFLAASASGLFAFNYAVDSIRAHERSAMIYNSSLNYKAAQEYRNTAADSGLMAIGLGGAALYLSALGYRLTK